ncbi:MAG TPA: hypothetical protein G4O00_06140 [Thermoflexia bacterium]|nr:hypothetical protein [Thermoflexia bacterium]
MARWFAAEDVTPEELRIALGDPRFRWVYAERMEDVVLTWRDAFLEDAAPLERWTHGRAFGPEAELAWWWDEGRAEARAIVEGGPPPTASPGHPIRRKTWSRFGREG